MLTRPDRRRLAELAKSLESGELVLPVSRRFGLHEAAAAHELAEAGGLGKIVLLPEQTRRSAPPVRSRHGSVAP
jgi:NADPH:quinone reductase-like Zn-dependent oxidoreductase